MTAQQTATGEAEAAPGAVPLDSFRRITRAARIKPAGGRHHWRKKQLIGADHQIDCQTKHLARAGAQLHLTSPRRFSPAPMTHLWPSAARAAATRLRGRLKDRRNAPPSREPGEPAHNPFPGGPFAATSPRRLRAAAGLRAVL